MEKNVPKKYMLILQRRYGGQTAVEFFPTGEVRLTPVFSHKDIKLEFTTKKDSKVKKNTLAFYDSITTRLRDFDSLLANIGENIYPFDYKKETSYIGYMNNGYMNKLSLVFQDPILNEIAVNTVGNQININNKTTMNVLSDIMDMIENLDSDFLESLVVARDGEEKKYNIDESLINVMRSLKTMIRLKQNRGKYGYVVNNSLDEDIEQSKKEILIKMKSYKTFRELYRFRKSYLYDRHITEYIEIVRVDLKRKTEEEFLKFKEHYEEVRQKEYPRNKGKIKQLDGQLSFFD